MQAWNSNDSIDLFDDFTLDLGRGCLTRAGAPIHLRPQTYEVLRYLVENRGHLISKDKLIEQVWKGRSVTDNSLVKCIEEVRETLGPKARQYIRNVHGRGYIFDNGIEKPSAVAATSVSSEQIDVVRVLVAEEETDSVAAATSSSSRSVVGTRTAALVIAILLVAGIATYLFIDRRYLETRRINTIPFHEIDVSRLTSSGRITHAAISPNGKYVAHILEGPEGDSLWVKNLTAPSNVRIAGPSASAYISVTFAPDSESVYYLTLERDKGDTVLYRVKVLGGESSITARDVGPVAFSPDWKQMAFVRISSSESFLIVANADGTKERPLATRRQPEFFRMEWNAPAWSPNGKTIACPIRLHDDRGNYETFISVDVEQRLEKPLTTTRWKHVNQSAWLADGSGLLATASESDVDPEQIWYIPLGDGEAKHITHDLDNYHDLTLTANSRTIAVVQDHAVSSIWVASEGDAQLATRTSSEVGWLDDVAWAPNNRIVYRSQAGGAGGDIWIMDADGSNQKQLTVDARASRGLAVTPDGRYIIFVSDRAGHFNLWRVDIDGNNLRQLTGGDGEFYPHCTPDGSWVVYQRGEIEPTLWRVRIDGGEPVQLSSTRALHPNVSPDGKNIAYHYLDPELQRWGIGIVEAKGGPLLMHFDFPQTVDWRFVRWAPDGRSIAYPNRPGGVADIWLQPLDGSQPKQLTRFKADQILAFDWSRDGRSLAIVRLNQTSDVVLIEQSRK